MQTKAPKSMMTFPSFARLEKQNRYLTELMLARLVRGTVITPSEVVSGNLFKKSTIWLGSYPPKMMSCIARFGMVAGYEAHPSFLIFTFLKCRRWFRIRQAINAEWWFLLPWLLFSFWRRGGFISLHVDPSLTSTPYSDSTIMQNAQQANPLLTSPLIHQGVPRMIRKSFVVDVLTWFVSQLNMVPQKSTKLDNHMISLLRAAKWTWIR